MEDKPSKIIAAFIGLGMFLVVMGISATSSRFIDARFDIGARLMMAGGAALIAVGLFVRFRK